MVFKRFRLNCTLRLILLGATIFLFLYLLFQTQLYATVFIVAVFIIYQVFALFHYVEKTNRDVTRFLLSIKYSDFSQPFSSTSKGSTFKDLHNAFSEVLQNFRRIRMEKEEHHRFIQTIIQHVGVGLISFDINGDVTLINNAAKRLLKIPNLRNVKLLSPISTELADTLLNIQPGEKEQVTLLDEDRSLQLSIYATGFVSKQQPFTLVSLTNIRPELEEKEMEAWQTLIRTLTHEIMNSIAPISSLASTTKSMLSSDTSKFNPEDEDVLDIVNAVKTIEKRSNGLLRFVEDYRKLTRIPKPKYEVFLIEELLNRIKNLMGEQIQQYSIDFQVSVDPETLELSADPNMMEQVLINLCKNSVEALENTSNPTIKMIAKTDGRGRPVIQVEDNGPGIKAENLESIFIPFYTTKSEGSGIGLSLSKQIMRMHGATINVSSELGVNTVFTMRF